MKYTVHTIEDKTDTTNYKLQQSFFLQIQTLIRSDDLFWGKKSITNTYI